MSVRLRYQAQNQSREGYEDFYFQKNRMPKSKVDTWHYNQISYRPGYGNVKVFGYSRSGAVVRYMNAIERENYY